MKLYTNKNRVIGFTRKVKGYNIEETDMKHSGSTVGKITMDSKQIKKAFNNIYGHVRIRIKKYHKNKILCIEDGYKECYIAEINEVNK